MSEPQRVCLNARFLSEPVTGLQRWGREVLGALDSLFTSGEIEADKWQVILLCPKGDYDFPDYKFLKLKQGGYFQSHLWEQLSLSKMAPELLVCMKTTGPAFRRKPTAAMIHDTLVWDQTESYSANFLRTYNFIVPRLIKNSQALMTLSNDSAKRLGKKFMRPATDFKVIHCGHEHALRTPADNSILTRMNLTKGKFALAVSSMMRNKNFRGAAAGIREAGLTDLPLVVVGGTHKGVFNNSEVMPEDARYTGRINDRELRALYENSLCLVYPSFHEGFGLPPLEAMALGCPTIVSKKSSLPEVCGDAALYCDPNSSASIAQEIRRLYDAPGLVAELKIKGRAQAAKFSWQDCARRFWDVVVKTAS